MHWRNPRNSRLTKNLPGGYFRPAIVMQQDFRVCLSLSRHDCGANLAQADAVSPPGASQNKTVLLAVQDEGGTVEVRGREGPANFEFLADDQSATLALDLQTEYSSRWTPRQGLQIGDPAEIHTQSGFDQSA